MFFLRSSGIISFFSGQQNRRKQKKEKQNNRKNKTFLLRIGSNATCRNNRFRAEDNYIGVYAPDQTWGLDESSERVR